jgi:hypothetical protein
MYTYPYAYIIHTFNSHYLCAIDRPTGKLCREEAQETNFVDPCLDADRRDDGSGSNQVLMRLPVRLSLSPL